MSELAQINEHSTELVAPFGLYVNMTEPAIIGFKSSV